MIMLIINNFVHPGDTDRTSDSQTETERPTSKPQVECSEQHRVAARTEARGDSLHYCAVYCRVPH